MTHPGSRKILWTIGGLIIVSILAIKGLVVLGDGGPVSPAARLVQGVKSQLQGAVQSAPACIKTVSELALLPGMAADDVRLQGKHLIVVHKADRRLQRFSGGAVVKLGDGVEACWPVGLGPAPQGHKYRQGDGRTPEGWYRTSDKPWSQWYAAIAVHYPNGHDAQAGRVQGRIDKPTERRIQAALAADKKPLQSTGLGGEILIHGQGSTDWTLGCIGMENPAIEALRASLPKNMQTDVLILP
jgi:murein L,D-transpeptidase YafK